MPTGAGVGAGPFHSQSNEAWFVHTPGLKVVYPSNPADAKGLLLAAFDDPNPYLFFEHKALYRSTQTEMQVPDGYYTIPIGKANLVQQGTHISIVTYGMGVHWAQDFLNSNPTVSADLIDLRTLLPWDKTTVEQSVRKTGRLIILHEDCLTGGIGAEIAAHIAETCFDVLDAPIARVGGLDTPVPFALTLEDNFLPIVRFQEKIKSLLAY
jgi:2-oxoisovalerate dehydrogenase E1 component